MCTLGMKFSFSLCVQFRWKPGMRNTSKSSWQPGINSGCLWQLTVNTNTNCTNNTLSYTNTGMSSIVIWLELKCFRSGEIKIPDEYCQKDLDYNSDFKVLLPRRQGPGLCSTALVSYLISLHNDLVYCVDKHTGEETRWGRSCHIFLTCTCLAVRTQCVNFFLKCILHLCIGFTERLLKW